MDDTLLLRYSRQILLPDVDISGQQKLADARVLIVGLGGLGSPVSMYLAAGGVGQLHLADFDTVELSNLQRQIVHGTSDIGRAKVLSARDRLLELNPLTQISTIEHSMDEERLEKEVASVDIVVDCTDNFTTRYAINLACFKHRKALVSGAAIRFEGQVSVFFPGVGENPCYRCLYSGTGHNDETCTQTGVIAPLLGIIGGVQALETMKIAMGIGNTLVGRLLLFDGMSLEWQTMKFKRDPECPVCRR